jgi:hypothetical protein
MAIIGIQQVGKPNKINSNIQGLPLVFSKGSISVSLNFEQHPTGSISIVHVPETQIESYRNEYNQVGRTLILFRETSRPLYFEISSYAETEDAIFVSENFAISTFDIVVSLRGGHERKVNQPFLVKKPKSRNRVITQGRISNNTFKIYSYNLVNNNTFEPQYDLTSAFKNNKVNLTDFGNLVDVPYEGYSYVVNIPADASGEYSLTFDNLIKEKLRINSQILDYNGPVVKTYDYLAGKTWQITNQDIIYSLEFSKQEPQEYSETVLTGKDGLPFLSKSQVRKRTIQELLGDQQERKEPVELVLEEGDENPTDPPPDVKKLTTLDLNFDLSGPRKIRKVTKLLNGQPMEEELFVYGFAYLGQQIRNAVAESATGDYDDPPLLSNSPDQFWTLIEYQKTTYNYEVSEVKIRLKAKDKETNRSLPVYYTSTKLGVSSTEFENRYLTGITTTGWKLGRFQQEQYDDFGGDPVDLDSRVIHDALQNPEDDLFETYYQAMQRSITFRRIPYKSRTQYKLVPTSNLYDDFEDIPFRTEVVNKSDLDLGESGKAVIAIPDPNYVFPLHILEERTLIQSFAQMDHPQNILIRDEMRSIREDNSLSEAEKEEDLKGVKLLPWLTTGEDTYQATLRKIQPSQNTISGFGSSGPGKNEDQETDLYVEYTISASNQDSKFQYSLQEGDFKTVAGRPPTAQVFSYETESRNDDDQDDIDPFNFDYIISSTNDRFAQSIDSVQYETRILDEGLTAAKVDLELQNFLNTYENTINLAWYYPEIRPGDYIETLDNYNRGKLRVKSVSFTVDFQGHVSDEVIKTCSGTNLNCGRFEEKEITSSKKDKNTIEGLDLETVVSGEDTFGITIYANVRSRRNPGGEEVVPNAEP